MSKQQILQEVEALRTELKALNDFIFDHPELGNQEVEAHARLVGWLEQEEFKVEREICGLSTAFRAVHEVAGGGLKIGLLCEYDALEGLGHACGHNLQGPAILGAAIALKRILRQPATLIVLGTPAEETASGKLVMARAGVFDELDVAFMMHGSDSTTVDGKSLALNLMDFHFHGKAAHAAIAPQQGISALDAVLLFFNGMEYLREHVEPEVRFHGIITNGGQAANIVPAEASAQFYVRAQTREQLDPVLERVCSVARGAAMQVGATLDIHEVKAYDNKVNVPVLNQLLLDIAAQLGVPDITPPRKVTGSTDFSSVTYRVPGACLRVKFVERGVTSHSQEWLDRGKSQMAEDAIVYAAKALSVAVIRLLEEPELLAAVRQEFTDAKQGR